MKTRIAVLSLLLLFAWASFADAGIFCRRRCNVCAVAEVAEVVVAPVVVATFVPVQVPTYSVTYSPQVIQQTSTTVTHQTYAQQQVAVQEDLQLNALLAEARECQARLKAYQDATRPRDPLAECQAQLAAMKAELDALKSGQPLTPKPPPVPPAATPSPVPAKPAALLIFKNSCAACHDAKVAPTNGKGFALLSGDQIAPLTDGQLGKILSKVYLQTMPKQPNKFGIKPLTDEEVGALVAWVSEKQK